MLDRKTFLRPIAHRGLHAAARGIIENTEAAFTAALAKNYGIECDLTPASDGTPMVFHDATLDRLVDAKGPVRARTPAALGKLAFKGRVAGHAAQILTLDAFFEVVDGRVPLLVEIKSDWTPADPAFLAHIAKATRRYKGPVALMSFDPDIMTALRALAPAIPRGIVSGHYTGPDWHLDTLGRERGFRLTHLLESKPAAPDFYSYHIKAMPSPVTRFVREVLGLPLFSWTIRTPAERRRAARWSDAPTFEGYEP